MHECSVIGRTESEDGPWLAQTWDWYVDAPERTVMWNAVADDGARFLTMTEAGLLAKTGVSERGLALSLNMLSHRDDALPAAGPDPPGAARDPGHLRPGRRRRRAARRRRALGLQRA